MSPSSQIATRSGRRPFRSSFAPLTMPSVKTSPAGPSHGSTAIAW